MYDSLNARQKIYVEKHDANKKALPLYPVVVSFKNICFNFDYVYIFFSRFSSVKKGNRKVQGVPMKSLNEQNWPCYKIGQGHTWVKIYLNFVGLKSFLLCTKFHLT